MLPCPRRPPSPSAVMPSTLIFFNHKSKLISDPWLWQILVSEKMGQNSLPPQQNVPHTLTCSRPHTTPFFCGNFEGNWSGRPWEADDCHIFTRPVTQHATSGKYKCKKFTNAKKAGWTLTFSPTYYIFFQQMCSCPFSQSLWIRRRIPFHLSSFYWRSLGIGKRWVLKWPRLG